MIWGLTSTDFKNAGQNSVYMAGHYWGGIAVAATINITAHKFFKLKQDSWGSFIANGVSFAVGTALSLALAPRAALIDMAFGTSCKLAAISAAVMLCTMKLISPDAAVFFAAPPYLGACGGGERSMLYAAGGMGSFVGIIYSNDYIFPPAQSRRA